MMAKAMSRLRNLAFWLLDSAKGAKIKTAYKRLKAFDAIDSTSLEMLEHQKNALEKILKHACTTTEFYKEYHSAILSDFPVIDKNIIRARQDDFMSDKFDKADLITMKTSGSTGIPFTCYQDRDKKRKVNAEVIFYSEKAGYSVGGKLIYLRALTRGNHKPRLHQLIQNETLLDISRLDDQNIEQLLTKIAKASRNGAMMLAYAATYDALVDYFRRKGTATTKGCKVNGIISSSEMLFDETRKGIAEAFNCHCFSRYSNQENGIIGQDDIENNTFVLNESHYIIEVLEMNTDKPVENDAIGRIVVTDLYNYAMPMIRYDTGDIGSITYVKRRGVQKKAITNFGGRRVDSVFDCYGNRISPHIITINFWAFPEITQFQFIQESKTRYNIKINTRETFLRQDEVRAAMLKILGNEAEITIENVAEIPVLASGKRKPIINKMNWG